jgi:pimeloyl-ACP methyl ester carboxylesterase
MSTFILVHGAWHGGWCWKKIIPLLEEGGHKVIAPDLPGHGENKVPIVEITLQLYVNHVCQIIDSQAEPVILVAHSLGGSTISQAAENRPGKIKALVYLSGLLLLNGEAAVNYTLSDTEAIVLPNLTMPEDLSYSSVNEEIVKEAFYGHCSEEDINYAKPRLVPEASAPFQTPVVTTEEKFGQIPRVYISCLKDKAIGPSTQKKMYTNLPCDKLIRMDTDHSPFFSAPEELAMHLLSI